jgi:alpha,alpha-trehalose phosphorylase
VTQEQATYVLLAGAPIEIGHHGKVITVSADGPVTEAVPPAVSCASPSQPPGRAPARRGKTHD